MTKPLILITNDDGIGALGLSYLWQAAKELGDVAIIAPASERSGSGAGITWAKPIRIEPRSWPEETPAWSVTGTPADCVKMGISLLLKRRPSLILSGINKGSNAGRTVIYSGTVGAIMDGVLRGIPGIAFSFTDFTPPPFAPFAPFVKQLISHSLQDPLPKGTLLNVTFPPFTGGEIKGMRFARQGRGYFIEAPEERFHPDGAPYYWLGGKWDHHPEEHPESDIALLHEGFITAVPLHIDDLTSFPLLEKLRTQISLV